MFTVNVEKSADGHCVADITRLNSTEVANPIPPRFLHQIFTINTNDQ